MDGEGRRSTSLPQKSSGRSKPAKGSLSSCTETVEETLDYTRDQEALAVVLGFSRITLRL